MEQLINFDRTVVAALNDAVVAVPWLDWLIRAVAVYGVYLVPIVFVTWWLVASHRDREELLSALLTALVAWLGLNAVWKLFIVRSRPDETLPIAELLFRRPDTSFPSDHAALLFGLAAWFVIRRYRRSAAWLGVLAAAVGVARVVTAVHYPSDIVVGALDGFIAAWLVSVFHNRLRETVWPRLIAWARKCKLA